MQAGLLTERIKIITSQIVKNEYGEEIVQWVDKYSTRARLVNRSGYRQISNNEVVYDYSKTLEVRSYVPVDEFDRIQWNSKTWRILDITPNKKNNNKTINIELVNE